MGKKGIGSRGGESGHGEGDELLARPSAVILGALPGSATHHPELGHCIDQSPGDEIESPIERFAVEEGEHLREGLGEALEDMAVALGEEIAQALVAFGVGMGEHLHEKLAAAGVEGEIEGRIDEGGDERAQIALAASEPAIESDHPLLVEPIEATAEDLVHEAVFGAEVVVHRREVHAGFGGEPAQAHPIEAMDREHSFGGRKDSVSGARSSVVHVTIGSNGRLNASRGVGLEPRVGAGGTGAGACVERRKTASGQALAGESQPVLCYIRERSDGVRSWAPTFSSLTVQPLGVETIMAIERTLSIVKPDAVAKNLIGEIYSRFERAGLKIVAAKMKRLTREEAERFYEVHRERPFYRSLVEYMCSGPVMIQVLEGEDAIARNRELMGATNPREAKPGTIRADFAESIEANAVHGSDGPETAKREIAFFFAESEIHSR